jgi:hypothetical protein
MRLSRRRCQELAQASPVCARTEERMIVPCRQDAYKAYLCAPMGYSGWCPPFEYGSGSRVPAPTGYPHDVHGFGPNALEGTGTLCEPLSGGECAVALVESAQYASLEQRNISAKASPRQPLSSKPSHHDSPSNISSHIRTRSRPLVSPCPRPTERADPTQAAQPAAASICTWKPTAVPQWDAHLDNKHECAWQGKEADVCGLQQWEDVAVLHCAYTVAKGEHWAMLSSAWADSSGELVQHSIETIETPSNGSAKCEAWAAWLHWEVAVSVLTQAAHLFAQGAASAADPMTHLCVVIGQDMAEHAWIWMQMPLLLAEAMQRGCRIPPCLAQVTVAVLVADAPAPVSMAQVFLGSHLCSFLCHHECPSLKMK